MLHNGYCTDMDGKSIRGVGNSYWVSGASNIATPTEIRRINIQPSAFLSDDDSSTRSMQVYAMETGAELFPSESTGITGVNGIGGVRVQTSSDSYVYLPPPPSGWKAIGCRLEMYDRSTQASKGVVLEVFSRNINPNNAAITIHVNKSALQNTGTDVSFSTHYVPSAAGDTYLMAYVGSGSASHVYTGGWMSISRV